jgi:hypothetical protein
MPPLPAIPLASESFSHDLPQDLLTQGQVSDELLQIPVLLPELPQLAYLRHAQTPEPLLPAVEGRSLTPSFRQISSTGVPASACRRAIAICSGLYRLVFMVHPLWLWAESWLKTRAAAAQDDESRASDSTRYGRGQASGEALAQWAAPPSLPPHPGCG